MFLIEQVFTFTPSINYFINTCLNLVRLSTFSKTNACKQYVTFQQKKDANLIPLQIRHKMVTPDSTFAWFHHQRASSRIFLHFGGVVVFRSHFAHFDKLGRNLVVWRRRFPLYANKVISLGKGGRKHTSSKVSS